MLNRQRLTRRLTTKFSQITMKFPMVNRKIRKKRLFGYFISIQLTDALATKYRLK